MEGVDKFLMLCLLWTKWLIWYWKGPRLRFSISLLLTKHMTMLIGCFTLCFWAKQVLGRKGLVGEFLTQNSPIFYKLFIKLLRFEARESTFDVLVFVCHGGPYLVWGSVKKGSFVLGFKVNSIFTMALEVSDVGWCFWGFIAHLTFLSWLYICGLKSF